MPIDGPNDFIRIVARIDANGAFSFFATDNTCVLLKGSDRDLFDDHFELSPLYFVLCTLAAVIDLANPGIDIKAQSTKLEVQRATDNRHPRSIIPQGVSTLTCMPLSATAASLAEVLDELTAEGAPELTEHLDKGAVRCYACGHRCLIK